MIPCEETRTRNGADIRNSGPYFHFEMPCILQNPGDLGNSKLHPFLLSPLSPTAPRLPYSLNELLSLPLYYNCAPIAFSSLCLIPCCIAMLNPKTLPLAYCYSKSSISLNVDRESLVRDPYRRNLSYG